MKEAVILHTLGDAKDYAKRGMHSHAMLFSTNSNLDIYLKEYYNIECQCLSKFVTTEEASFYKNMASEKVERVLQEIDLIIAPQLNQQFNLKMRYFVPLYGYLSKYHLLAYFCFVEAVKRVKEFYKLDKIAFYEYRFNNYFDIDSDMSYLIPLFFPDLDFQILKSSYLDKLKHSKLVRAIEIIKNVNRQPLWATKLVLNRFADKMRHKYFSNNKQTILLYEDLYEVDFLKNNLSQYNVLYYTFKSEAPAGFKCDVAVDKINLDFQNFQFVSEKEDPLLRIFLKDIKDDFTRNINGYIKAITLLRKINKKHQISLGIWGSSPIYKLRPLIFEYLMSEGIKVFGSQHGGGYGDFFEPWHFDSDFNHCDYFATCGFNKDDVKRLYPKKETKCEFIPVGKVKLIENHLAKKKIDILFPIARDFSMLQIGMSRILPHKLSQRQILLLEYLNSLKNLNVYVKPCPFPNDEDYAFSPVFKRLKNLKIVTNMLLKDFLKKYAPRAVLIEFPSQPLYECLCLPDLEIFVMNDDLHPFENQALSGLKKRVYYCEDVNEITDKIGLFAQGKLESKRDNSFYNHYIYKKNTKLNIVKMITSLTGVS